jgi:hypothetical protein
VGFRPGMHMLARLRLGTALHMEQRRLGAGHDRQRNLRRHLTFLDTVCVRIQPGHVLQYGLRTYQQDRLKTPGIMREDALRANIIRRELGTQLANCELRIVN